jgi:hypothetical protein
MDDRERGGILGRMDMTDVTMTSQPQIYRVAIGWRISSAAVILPLILLMGWIMVMPFLVGRSDRLAIAAVCFLVGGGGMLLFLYFFLSVLKSKIEVYPDKLRNVGVFRASDIPIGEMAGFRVLPTQYAKVLLLQPKDTSAKKIKITMVFADQAALLDWLNQNLTNLDSADFQEEMNQVLHDTRLGETEEQRLWVLGRAKRWAMILNGAGVIVMFWAMIRPHPYNYVIWTLIALPLVVLGFVRRFEGVLRLDGKKQSAFPNAALAFFMPCLALTLRAFTDFNILNWDSFWIPFAICSATLCLVLLQFAKDARRKIGTAIVPVVLCVLYGYSAVISLNGILDTSTPSFYEASVTRKRVSRGKHTSYYLKLSPWGPMNEEKEVDVGKFVYDRRAIGDRAEVVVRNGRLGIPWFYVR